MLNVMGYSILEEKKVPSFLKDKPRWVTCIAFAVAMLIITAVAVTTGVFIGYTYCYLEHRSDALKGNISHPRNVQIVRIPMPEQPTPYNKTINGALASNYIISKILRISGVLVDGEMPAPRYDPQDNRDSTTSLSQGHKGVKIFFTSWQRIHVGMSDRMNDYLNEIMRSKT